METAQKNFINVPSIEPRFKHSTIFQVFDSLAGGESLTIHNDHDPKPVYYQLLGERGDIFTWEYLQQGPEWWDILVTKKLDQDTETVGEIAVKDLRKAAVFKKYGIDFCCGGKKTLKEACAEKNIDFSQVDADLKKMDTEARISNVSYSDWSIDFLADYIVNTHHSYVKKYLPEIVAYANKVAKVHGDRHPELLQVRQNVQVINDELIEHMAEEERELFPYIKKIAQARSAGLPLVKETKDLASKIDEYEDEHTLVGELLEKTREITNGYAIPGDACASYTLLFKMLQEFEDDLHLHIHLENNILFPKSIDLEKSYQ